MTVTDEKYIVFKRSEWEAFAVSGANAHDHPLNMVYDAVVIRTRDTFAGPALHSYAASIGVAARVIGIVDPLKAKGLMDIADYFSERAEEADTIAHSDADKLPD